MAKKEYLRLKEDMTQEEIDVVTLHLKKNSMIRYADCIKNCHRKAKLC